MGCIMPINLACPCGKQLTAKDEFAGKRTKCPGCGTLLDIPQLPLKEPPLEVIEVPDEPPVKVAAVRVIPEKDQETDDDDKPRRSKRRKKTYRGRRSSGFNPAYGVLIGGIFLTILGLVVFIGGLMAGWFIGYGILLFILGLGAVGKSLSDLGSL